MKISIVVDDDCILIDSVPKSVNLSELREIGLHALQWDGNIGDLEWGKTSARGRANETITSIEPFQKYIDAWSTAEPYGTKS